jgi:hypothetical protein
MCDQVTAPQFKAVTPDETRSEDSELKPGSPPRAGGNSDLHPRKSGDARPEPALTLPLP